VVTKGCVLREHVDGELDGLLDHLLLLLLLVVVLEGGVYFKHNLRSALVGGYHNLRTDITLFIIYTFLSVCMYI
jgi:hypothetical protein